MPKKHKYICSILIGWEDMVWIDDMALQDWSKHLTPPRLIFHRSYLISFLSLFCHYLISFPHTARGAPGVACICGPAVVALGAVAMRRVHDGRFRLHASPSSPPRPLLAVPLHCRRLHVLVRRRRAQPLPPTARAQPGECLMTTSW